jgi:hypothetical protein
LPPVRFRTGRVHQQPTCSERGQAILHEMAA